MTEKLEWSFDVGSCCGFVDVQTNKSRNIHRKGSAVQSVLFSSAIITFAILFTHAIQWFSHVNTKNTVYSIRLKIQQSPS